LPLPVGAAQRSAELFSIGELLLLRGSGSDFWETPQARFSAIVTPQSVSYGARALVEKTLLHLLCRTKLLPSEKSRIPARGFYLHSSQFVREPSSALLRP
jgi:hypothetical protein